LPLIGGSVTLIGNPTAAAVPPTRRLLDSYNTWLEIERRALLNEIYGRDRQYDPLPWNNPGDKFFLRPYGEPALPEPSTRAAIVLGAVGCTMDSLL
jgi:hypothetical protein